MKIETFDALVIGGGQGDSLARLLAEGGKNVALVEKEYLGGSGCTPTKAHLACAKRAHDARHAAKLGVHVGEVQVNLAQIVARSQKIIHEFRGELNQEIEKTPGLNLIRGRAKFVAPHEIEVSGRRLKAEKIILAVGTRTLLPEVEGLENVRCLTHRELLALEEVPEHLLILGGGYIACEFGQMFRRFGAKVTIVQKGDQLLDREDEDVANAVAEFLRDEGINVRFGCDLQRVENHKAPSPHPSPPGRGGNGFRAHFSDGSSCDATHLLVAAGQTPNTDDLGLENTDVNLTETGHVKVNDALEAAPGVWALGDCKGGPAFTHIAYNDACRLASHLLDGKQISVENRVVPYTVFTDPQLGRVGMNECEAREKGVPYRVALLKPSDTARGIETGQTCGFFKVLVGEDDQILGAAMLGDQGGELMGALQIAMMGGVKTDALRNGTFAHPTWIESFNLLFQTIDCDSDALHSAY